MGIHTHNFRVKTPMNKPPALITLCLSLLPLLGHAQTAHRDTVRTVELDALVETKKPAEHAEQNVQSETSKPSFWWRVGQWAIDYYLNKPKDEDDPYYITPRQRWIFSTQLGLTNSGLGMNHVDARASMNLRTPSRISQSVTVSYRGLSLTLPILNIDRTNDRDFSFAMFGNRIGIEASLRRSTSLSGKINHIGTSAVVEMPSGSVACRDFDLDAYYAFQSKRFSFPAAYNLSYIQQRSAGSAFLSASIRRVRSTLDSLPVVTSGETRIASTLLCVGGGYGHNFVLPDGWMFHFSGLTSIALITQNRLTVDGHEELLRNKFPNMVNTLNLCVVRNGKRWFGGLRFRLHHATYGHSDYIKFTSTRTQLSFTVGVRI